VGYDRDLESEFWVSFVFFDDFFTDDSMQHFVFSGSIRIGNSGEYLSSLNSYVPHYTYIRAYNVVFGLFQAPYYSFSQTMMAEVMPPGFDTMVCLKFCARGLLA
jgi:hypothetical protein